jgi:hypothetical protein
MNNNIAMDGIPPIVDPMQFNAPMELYDSIWVGKLLITCSLLSLNISRQS